MNPVKIENAVNAALAALSEKRLPPKQHVAWENAIKKASIELLGNVVVIDAGAYITVTASDDSKFYKVDGTCECPAYQNKKPCYHRAMYRLVRIMAEGDEARRERYQNQRTI